MDVEKSLASVHLALQLFCYYKVNEHETKSHVLDPRDPLALNGPCEWVSGTLYPYTLFDYIFIVIIILQV